MRAKSNIYSSVFIFRLALLFTLFIINDNAFAQIYGLKFQSHGVVQDERTELNLSPDGFFNFQDEFEISFDYNIYLSKPNDYSAVFGYLFRVISSKNNNIDLVISHPPDIPDIYLNLINGEKDSVIHIGSIKNALDGWVNLRIKFLLNEDRLIVYTPDNFYVQENIGMKKDHLFKIIFGANDYGDFKTSDVSSVNIKEIRVSERGKLEYHWPLDEEKGDIAEDRINKKSASVKNPSWLKNNHQMWEPRYQNEFNGFILVSSDNENGKIFLVGDEELFIYSAQENNLQSIKYRGKALFLTANYTSMYNSVDKKIYCYTLNTKLIYSLDIMTGEWNNISISSTSESYYRHYNSYFDPEENSIYFFYGYGQYTYHSEIRRLDLTKSEWQVLSTDKNLLPPRYLAGLGSLNDTIYLFGGFGSITGSQMVNPHSYFDLWGYSIKNQTLFKKFEIAKIYDDMCVGHNFWINDKNRDYYAVVFEKSKFVSALQLIKGNIDNTKVEMVGNKIPFEFYDIKSNASLFFFPKQNKLFAYTSFAKDSSTTSVKIYSIDNPPNISSTGSLKVKAKANLLFVHISIAFLILFGLLSWYLIRKRRSERISPETIKTDEQVNEKVSVESEESVFELPNERPNFQLVLFGGFQVFNLENEDITIKFSPLLKELFLLIYLHTHKNNKGISSENISECLWFDKTERSARNNRAVNIAKLKTIFSEMGEMELTKKTGYWKIIYNNKTVKSDYSDFLQITGSKSNLSKTNICRLLEITSKGSFLRNSNFEWLDDFKSDVSDKIIDTLVTFAEKCDLTTEAEFIVHLADCIFNFDKSNEEAMVLKCKAEYIMGKHSLAKMTYEKFIKEYRLLYDEEYKKPFNDLVKF